MADTLTTVTTVSTVPSGTVIGTDEVSIGGVSQHVQRVKLVDGTNGGTDLIGGDATNGLDVDVTRIASGASADIGAVADAAVITDTTGSLSGKLRGLVKWAFERMPASLGQKAKTASLPVVLASDQDALAVTLTSTTISGSVTVDSELTTADLDTGAGTDTRAVVGLVYGASGGGTLVSTTNPLPVGDNGGSLTVDGTVTANAGTNLNTSALAVESGGNLAGAATSLGVLDDWDESDRAKVNIIAGQAGVTAGAGAVAANTPRVTLASDDPAVVALQTLDNAISGSEMQVDIVGALPAGDNNIGNVDLASAIPAGTNNIGDVDVASIAAGDNNIGNVDIVTMPNVTIGTMANLTESLVDDAAFTPGTSRVLPVGFEFDDAAPDSVNEGDIGAARMSANRNVYTTLRDAAGNERGVNVTAGNALTVDGSAVTQPVSAASLPLPSGAATAANQSTGNTALSAIQTAVETLDNAISGSEMQVDIVGSLPAGTAAIGKLAANSGVDIGDVDVTSVTPGTTATALGKAEDAGHSSGDVGVMALAVRHDANTTLAGTDLDYAPFQVDADGSLKVAIISGAGSGGTAMTDDAAFTPGTTSITPVGGTYRSTRDTVNDNDGGAFAMTASRAILAAIETPNGDTAMDDTNDALRVNVVAGAAGGTQYTEADTDASITGTAILWEDTSDTLRAVSAAKPLPIGDAGGSLTVDNGGTFVIQENGAALTALQLIDDTVFAEDVAAQAADKGIQVLAVRRDADTSLVGTDNDYAPLQVNAAGALKVEIFDGGDSHTVDGTVAATQSGTWNIGTVTTVSAVTAISNALPAGNNNIGDVDIASALPAGTNNIGDVDILSIAAGDNNIGNVDIASIAAGDNNIGNVDVVTMPGVVGTVADDATTPGNPVMMGGKAVETDGTDPTSVSAEDDVAIFRTDRNRRMLVNTAHPNQWVARENHTSAQTNNELKAAPGANLSLYITDIIMSTDVATNIKLVRDTGGTPADIAGPFYFASNGGIAMPLVTPIRVTANQNVGFTGGATGNFTIEIHGYTAP